jgi:hypothetical protein
MDADFFRVIGAIVLIVAIFKYRILLGIAGIGLGIYMLATGQPGWGIAILLFGIYVTRFFYIEGKQ